MKNLPMFEFQTKMDIKSWLIIKNEPYLENRQNNTEFTTMY